MVKRVAAMVLLMGAVVAPAWAQTAGAPKQPAGAPAAGAEAAAKARDRTIAATAAHQLRASDLIGATAYGSSGKEIGRISDLLLDRKTGQVVGYVVTVGSFLGIGGKDIGVPYAKAEIVARSPDVPAVRISLNEVEVDAAPAIKFDKASVNSGAAQAHEMPKDAWPTVR